MPPRKKKVISMGSKVRVSSLRTNTPKPAKQIKISPKVSRPGKPATPSMPSIDYTNPNTAEERELFPQGNTPQYIESTRNNGSSSGMVFLILILLLTIVFWKDVVSKLGDLAFNPGSKNDITTLPWKPLLGGMFFILIAVGIANINDDAATLMTILALGLLTVYLVETGGGGFTTLFNWFNSAPTKSSGNQPPTTPGGSGTGSFTTG